MKLTRNFYRVLIVLAVVQFGLLLFPTAPTFGEKNSQRDLDIALKAGEAADQQGDYQKAEKEFERALTISRAINGEESAKTAECYNDLGVLFYQQRNYEKALSYHQKALDIRQKIGDGHDLDVAESASNLGTVYSEKGQFDTASNYLDFALEIFKNKLGPDHQDVATVYNNLGTVYDLKGEYEKALSYYEKALAILFKILEPDYLNIAATYNNLGGVYAECGEYDNSLRNYKNALDILTPKYGSTHLNLATSYCNMSETYFLKGDYNNALSYNEKALNILLNNFDPDDPNLEPIYNNFGVIYDAKGEYQAALSNYQKAQRITVKAFGSNSLEMATSYHNLGAFYDSKGEYDSAIVNYEKALSIWTELYQADHQDIAILYNNLGLAYKEKGEYDQAIIDYNKALQILLNIFPPDHPAVALVYNSLGSAYDAKKDFDNAILNYEKALKIRENKLDPDLQGIATVYNNLGLVYDETEQYEKAMTAYEKALAIFIQKFGPDNINVATTYNNLGAVYSATGQYDRAILNLKQAVAILTKAWGEDHPSIAKSYNNIGIAYAAKGDDDHAIYFCDKALAISKMTVSRQQTVDIACTIGQLYMQKGRNDEAERCFQEGINVIETARLELGAWKSEFSGRNLKIYQSVFNNQVLVNDKAGVFRTAELMKERGFLEQLSLTAALNSPGITSEDRDRLLQLAQNRESLRRSWQIEIKKEEAQQDQTLLCHLGERLEVFEKEYNVLDQKLKQNERYKILCHPEVISLENTRALCNDDTAILDYVIQEGTDEERQAYCLLITKNGLKIMELPKDLEYETTVLNLREAIYIKDDASIGQNSAMLYKSLIKPLQEKLVGFKQLVIVPDGALALLPFDVLREKDSDRYLGEDYLISLTPSASVLAMTKQRKVESRERFLGLGGAYYNADPKRSGQSEAISGNEVGTYYRKLKPIWGALPGTLDEVNTIKKTVFDAKNCLVFTGAQATEANIKKLSRDRDLLKYRIVHFACHGFYNADNPSFSTVIFSEVSGRVKSAEDGYLSVAEAALLNFNADFVNLSACQSGQGQNENGDGVIGLTRAFQVAGANRVGVTLWTVNDEATKLFMVAMYEKVARKGKSYVEAYAETKREFMHEQRYARYSTPEFWSAFVVYGL
jgi:tetratricopeptide (TPR) repeat protein